MKRKKLQAQFPGNANSTFCQKMARNMLAFICINTLLNLLFPLFSLFSLLFRLSAPVHQRDHLQNQTRKHRATMNFSFSNIPVGNPPFF